MFNKKMRVDGVLSALNKAINDLEVVQDNNEDLIEKNEAEAQRLLNEAGAARLEAERAASVRDKLISLIAP
jgi:hypothetical protein